MPRKNISQRLRFEVLRRDNFRCAYCGATAESAQLVVDHIEPYSKGGADDATNYATACHGCNSGKTDRVILPVEPQEHYPPDSVESSILNHVEAYFHLDTIAFVRCVLDVMRQYPLPEPGSDIEDELAVMGGGQIWAEWESWCVIEGGRRHRLEILKEFNIDPTDPEGWAYPVPPAEAMPAWMLTYYLGDREHAR